MSAMLSGTPRILLVVEDPAEGTKILSLFHDVAPERAVQLVRTAKEGLAAVESQDYEILMVDPEAGALVGTQFLHEVWKVRPKSVRFLLAHSIDPDVLVTCVLGSHHFLQKPLGPAGLQAALARADAINRLVRNERIQSLVSRMRTLPSRPSLYLEVMRELRSPNASANTVGEYVSKDLAISAKLIQVVNSAYYGLQQHVSDPAAAVLLLGLETTAALVLSIEAFARFDKVKPLYFSMDRVWKHCQGIAHAAKRIAELLSNDPEVARNAFTAGLLHDIGKLALALNFEEQYHGALKLAEKQRIPPCEVEAQVFGATHAEAGAYLLSLWGLPLPIVEAVAAHHCEAKAVGTQFNAATALHLAERLTYAEELARNGVKDIPVDLDYPPELELRGRMDELRALVRGEEAAPEVQSSEGSEGTMIFTRAQLKADPVPLPVSGEPGPVFKINPPRSAQLSRQTALLVAGCVLLGTALVVSWTFQRQPRGAGQTGIQTETGTRAAVAGKKTGESKTLSQSIEKAELKPEMAKAAADDFPAVKLQAILYNGAKSSIIMNGQSFRLGDEVEGTRIVAVERDQVTLERAGIQRKFRLR